MYYVYNLTGVINVKSEPYRPDRQGALPFCTAPGKFNGMVLSRCPP